MEQQHQVTKSSGSRKETNTLWRMRHTAKRLLRVAGRLAKLCNPTSIKKGLVLLRILGLRSFTKALINRLRAKPKFHDDAILAHHNNVGSGIFKAQQKESAESDMQKKTEELAAKPLITVIMLIRNHSLLWLKLAINSLQSQAYTNWELCAVEADTKCAKAMAYLKKVAKNDGRIRLPEIDAKNDKNDILNLSLNVAKGEFITLMNQNDELTKDALFWMVKEINSHPNADFIYSDECMLDEYSYKHNFFCKPDWSPTLLANFMYTGNLSLYRTAHVKKLGGFSKEYCLAQEYDLALRMGDSTKNIHHVERILYLQRSIAGVPVYNYRNISSESGKAALKDWYKANGMEVSVSINNSIYDASLAKPDVKVSVIIPSDNIKNMKKCLNDILGKTTYDNYEIVMVTNSKAGHELQKEYPALETLKICNYDKQGPFNFSDKCNAGAEMASGDIFCFYNDDLELINSEWLARLADALALPDVGAANPVLLWSKDHIQSAGFSVGTLGMVECAFASMDFYAEPSLRYHPHLMRDVVILSGACIAVTKDAFTSINGFDSENMPNAFSDMDISLRIVEAGYRNVCTPYSVILHEAHNTWNDSVEKDKSYPYFFHRWGHRLTRDPYFLADMKQLYFASYHQDCNIYMPQTPIKRKKNCQDILFAVNNLDRTASNITLIEKAQTHIASEDFTVVVSSADGALKQDLLEIGIPVIVDKTFENEDVLFKQLARNFDLVIDDNFCLNYPYRYNIMQ